MSFSTFEIFQLTLMLSCGSLSFLSSILVIHTILKNHLYNSYAFKILLYISINDLIKSSIGIFAPKLIYSTVLCEILAYFNYSMLFSNIVWACSLSCTIFQIIVQEDPHFERFYKHWLVGAYLIVFFLYSLPFITSSYGLSEGVCELTLDLNGNLWRFGVFYIPASIILVVCVGLFVKVYRKVKDINADAMKNIVFERGFIYPIIIVGLILPYEVVRVFQLFADNEILDFSALIFYCLCILHGFFNALVFLNNKTVKTVLQDRQQVYATMGIASDMRSTLHISFRSEIN